MKQLFLILIIISPFFSFSQNIGDTLSIKFSDAKISQKSPCNCESKYQKIIVEGVPNKAVLIVKNKDGVEVSNNATIDSKISFEKGKWFMDLNEEVIEELSPNAKNPKFTIADKNSKFEVTVIYDNLCVDCSASDNKQNKARVASINPYYDAFAISNRANFLEVSELLKSYGTLENLSENPFFNTELKNEILDEKLIFKVYEILQSDSSELIGSYLSKDFFRESYVPLLPVKVRDLPYDMDVLELLDSLFLEDRTNSMFDSLSHKKDSINSLCTNKQYEELLQFIKSEESVFNEFLFQRTVKSIEGDKEKSDSLYNEYFQNRFNLFLDTIKNQINQKEPVDQTKIEEAFNNFFDSSNEQKRFLEQLFSQERIEIYIDSLSKYPGVKNFLDKKNEAYNKESLWLLNEGFRNESLDKNEIKAIISNLDDLKDKIDLADPSSQKDKTLQKLKGYYQLNHWKDLIDPFARENNELENLCENEIIKEYLEYSFDRKEQQQIKVLADEIGKRINYFNNTFRETRLIAEETSVTAHAKIKDVLSLGKSVPGTSVTTFSDELSQFLIERAKQELNVAFFQRLSKYFEKTPEIQVLFPKTTDVLMNLLAHDYTNMISSLRNSFKEDLEGLFFKVDDVFKLPKYSELIKDFPEIILMLKSIQVVAELDDERHPSDIISDLVKIPEWNDSTFTKNFSPALLNFRTGLQSSEIFSNSLKYEKDSVFLIKISEKESIVQVDSALVRLDTTTNVVIEVIRKLDTTRTWVTRQHLNLLIQDTSIFNNYLALLYEKMRVANLLIAKRKNVINNEEDVLEDWFVLRNTILTENSYFNTASKINSSKITVPVTTEKDSIVTELSMITSGSKLKKNSIIYQVDSLHLVLKEEQNSAFLFRDYLVEFVEIVEKVERTIRAKRSKQDTTKTEKEKTYEFVGASIDAIEYAFNVSHLFQDDLRADKYLKIARNGNDMYFNIIQNEYAAAVNNLATILSDLSGHLAEDMVTPRVIKGSDSPLQIDLIKNQKDQNATKDEKFAYRKSLAEARRMKREETLRIKDLRKFSKFTSKVLKYGTFMANIVKSDSAEEIQAAIKSAAMPVGSYSIKRESRWDVSINAYLGAGYSREFINSEDLDIINDELKSGALNLDDPDLPALDDESRSFGVWAPVGIAGSYGIGRNKGGGSLSVFISLIDLGAIVDFRLQNQVGDSVMISAMDSVHRSVSVDKLPEITLENIFAPGAYLVYGIPSIPISVGAGIQQGPNLRRIDISENGEVFSTVKASAWRWNFFIAVDIPIVTLFNRPK